MEQIRLAEDRLEAADLEAVAAALRSGWLTMGPRTAALEAIVAADLGRAHAVLTASPAGGLHLALTGAGVGAGDEVIVSALAPPPVAAAVRDAGARALPAEVRGDGDLNIDPDAVARLVGPRTRAVVASHAAGYPADLERLARICAARGPALVEEALDAPLARTAGGLRCGSVGVTSALGFAPGGVLGAGRLGLLATDDEAIARRARLLRSHGMTSGSWSRHTGETTGYDVVELGFNHRPDEPRAALAASRWRRLEGEVASRRALTAAYRAALAPLAGSLCPAFGDEAVARSSCAAMAILLDDARRRDGVRDALLRRGGVHSGLLSAAPGAPRSSAIADAALLLPLFPALGAAGVERVVAALAAALRGPRARSAPAR